MNAIKAMTLQFITVVLAIIGADTPGHEITHAKQERQTSLNIPLQEKRTDKDLGDNTKSYLEQLKERSYADKLITIYP